MKGPLDEQYFVWLYGQVAPLSERRPSKTYWDLLRQLYKTEFVWLIADDHNRAEDGKALRQEFIHVQNVPNADNDWNDIGCCVLELLIGLGRRVSFQLGGDSAAWFWTIIENLGLDECSDITNYDQDSVDSALHHFMYREYSYNGTGGAFPLLRANEDQRHVEMWYQLNAYVLERF
jgi:hypothetical protein